MSGKAVKYEAYLAFQDLEFNKFYTSEELRLFIIEKINKQFTISTFHPILKFLMEKNIIYRQVKGLYCRTKKTLNEDIVKIVEQEREKRNQKIYYKNDVICQKILEIIQFNNPKGVKACVMRKQIEELQNKSYDPLGKRLRILVEEKLIKNIGHGISSTYILFENNDFQVQRVTLKGLYDLYLETKNQNNLLKAAFISIAKKLENGEEVRDVLIQTGKLISEMN